MGLKNRELIEDHHRKGNRNERIYHVLCPNIRRDSFDDDQALQIDFSIMIACFNR